VGAVEGSMRNLGQNKIRSYFDISLLEVISLISSTSFISDSSMILLSSVFGSFSSMLFSSFISLLLSLALSSIEVSPLLFDKLLLSLLGFISF
jgi:hypothetical protein